MSSILAMLISIQIGQIDFAIETDPLTGISQRRILIEAVDYSSINETPPILILSVVGTDNEFVTSLGIIWGTSVNTGDAFQVIAGMNGLESEYSALGVRDMDTAIVFDSEKHDLNRFLFNMCLLGETFRCSFTTYPEGKCLDATFSLEGLKDAAESAGYPLDLWRFWYSG